MKYLHNLHYSMLSWTYMFQMVQMEKHFISKWTLVCVVIYYHTIFTGRLQGHKAHMNYLHSTIDNSVNLVAYNKKIKQLGTCTLCVSCGPNTRMVKFFIVDSKFNPIIGLDDSHQLQLVKFNCPIHQSWTGQKSTNLNSFYSISDNPHGTIPTTLTKDWIVNHL